jgi:hypothetical protein
MSTTQTPEAASVSTPPAPYFDRVRERTPPRINRQIDRRTAEALDRLVSRPPADLARRLDQLDREWDIDRAVMATFGVLGGLNWVLSMRRWLTGRRPGRSAVLLGIQLGFLFHHARSGWCPPVSVLRRLGVRTRMEIEEERRVLLGILAQPRVTESMLVIAAE